jgi:quinol monooxygenase YgiN
MIISKLRLFPAPEHRHQVLELLRSVQGPTQDKPCCLAVQVYEEDKHTGAILYTEEWDSELEFCDHVRSELYRRVLAALDISISAPEFRFYRVSKAQGLELVDQLRNSPRSTGAVEEVQSILKQYTTQKMKQRKESVNNGKRD